MAKKFRCRRCGACCRWKGAVKVEPDEVDAVAGFLHIPLDEFLADHTCLTPDRKHLSLCEKPNGECAYLTIDDNGFPACAIEPVKPRQCRNFPEKWNFPNWQSQCSGEFVEVVGDEG